MKMEQLIADLQIRVEELWENGADIESAIDQAAREFSLEEVYDPRPNWEQSSEDDHCGIFRNKQGELINVWFISPMSDGKENIEGFGFDTQTAWWEEREREREEWEREESEADWNQWD